MGRIQNERDMATRGGVSAEGTMGGEVGTYLLHPQFKRGAGSQRVHLRVVPSFEWGLEAKGGAVVHAKACKRGRRVKGGDCAFDSGVLLTREWG